MVTQHNPLSWCLQGSGQSDGKYVTLGWREQDDLALAIQHLRALGTVSTIGLWGRSMGAVTALLYSQKDPSIAGVVRTIVDLAMTLCMPYRAGLAPHASVG